MGGSCAWLRELRGLGLEGLHQVEGVGWYSGPRGLDLTPEILGPENVESAVVGEVGEDVLFKPDDLGALAVLVVVISCGGFRDVPRAVQGF